MSNVAQFPYIRIAYDLLKRAEHKVFNVDLYNGLDAPILMKKKDMNLISTLKIHAS